MPSSTLLSQQYVSRLWRNAPGAKTAAAGKVESPASVEDQGRSRDPHLLLGVARISGLFAFFFSKIAIDYSQAYRRAHDIQTNKKKLKRMPEVEWCVRTRDGSRGRTADNKGLATGRDSHFFIALRLSHSPFPR